MAGTLLGWIQCLRSPCAFIRRSEEVEVGVEVEEDVAAAGQLGLG